MSQIEKDFLAEECGVDESQVNSSFSIKGNDPIEFAPHHHQKILDRLKIRTARKRDKSGEFAINGERFMAEFEVALTMDAFISLFDNNHYAPEEFGFDTENEMWMYYRMYFNDSDMVFVHKISEVVG